MTHAAYADYRRKELAKQYRINSKTAPETKEMFEEHVANDTQKGVHRNRVEHALRSGKHVPPEVLAEYPDLAPQPVAPKKAEPSVEPVSAKPKKAATAKPAAKAKAPVVKPPAAAPTVKHATQHLGNMLKRSISEKVIQPQEIDATVQMLGKLSRADLKDVLKKNNLPTLRNDSKAEDLKSIRSYLGRGQQVIDQTAV